MSYAESTSVSVSRTIGAIQSELQKRGVSEFGYMATESSGGFVFRHNMIPYRFTLRMPRQDERRFTHTPTGMARAKSAAGQLYEAESRRLWRALFLVIKAKLVAVEEGIVEFQDEFLAYAQLPDGRTAGEVFASAIEQSALSGKPLTLALPEPEAANG